MELAQIAQAIVKAVTVEIEASGRHVHLTAADVEMLFGKGHTLTPIRPLSQPGQFVCQERVTVVGPKGSLGRVVVLGPVRKESQVEVSATDGIVLGVTPPVRQSGHLEGTLPVILESEGGQVALTQGLMVAQRHIHMTPADGEKFGVVDGQRVALRCITGRPAVLEDTVVRISPTYATVVHLDYDEANACGWVGGDRARLV